VQGNNFFGIKGTNPKTGANTGPVGTWEEVNGQRVNIQDTFRAYGSYQESADDFAQFLKDNPRYRPALDYLNQNPKDWRGFIRKVHEAGYATDSQWSSKIVAIGNSIENGGAPTQNSTDTSGAANRTSTSMLGPDRTTGRQGIKSVIDVANQAIGTRYQYGGPGGRSDFGETLLPTDCSGFVSWAYERATGLRVPAYTGDIWRTTRGIRAEEAVPGDLVMFNMDNPDPGIQHVGIYLGNGKMIHDSSLNPNGGVDITSLWKGAEFRRVAGVDPSLVNAAQPTDRPGLFSQPLNLPHAADYSFKPQPLPPGEWSTFVPDRPGPGSALKRSPLKTWGAPQGMGNDLGAGADDPKPSMSKKEASYVKKAPEDHCADCSMFRNQKCTLVKGQINPGGSCDYFEPKQAGVGAGQEGFTEGGGGGALIEENDEERERRRQMEIRRYMAEKAALGMPPRPTLQQGLRDANAAIDRRLDEAGQAFRTSAEAGTLPQDIASGIAETGGGALSALGTTARGAADTIGGALSGPGQAIQAAGEEAFKTDQGPSRIQQILNPPTPQPSAQETVQQAITPAIEQAPSVLQGIYQGAQELNRQTPGQGAVEIAQNIAANPDVQRTAQVADQIARVMNPMTSGSTMAPGVEASVRFMKDNGYDTTPVENIMNEQPSPGSVSEYVAKGGVINNPFDGARLMWEAWDKSNRIREEALKQAQAPEIRDTPEGWANRQVLMVASDPTTYIGLPAGGIADGARTLRAAEMAERATELKGLGLRIPEVRGRTAAEIVDLLQDQVLHDAFARPYTEDEMRAILQRASLDLNSTALEALSTPAKGKFEPLSGEQIRRVVMNAVGEADPTIKPGDLLRKTDDILRGADHPGLTTDALLASGEPVFDDVVQAGLPWFRGTAADGRLLESKMRASINSLEDNTARRALANSLPARASAQFALGLGVGGLAAGHELATNNKDDPNLWGKAFAKGATGFLLGVTSPYMAGAWNRTVTPAFNRVVLDNLNSIFAPINLLRDETKNPLQAWVGERMQSTAAALMHEDRWRSAFGDMSPDDWWELAKEIEKTDALPARFAGNARAQEALDLWRNIALWARKYDIIPEPIKFPSVGGARLYLPHVRATEWDTAMSKVGAAKGPGQVSRDPFRHYKVNREFATLEAGEAAGVKYEKDLPQLLGSYYKRALDLVAHERLAEQISNLAAKNDPSLISPAALARWVIQDSDVVRWPKTGLRGLNRPSDARHINSVDALRHIQDQHKVGINLDDVYISEDMYRVLQNMFGEESSNLLDNKAVRALTIDLNSVFRHNVLSGIDFYHPINEIRQMFATQGAYAPRTLWQTFTQHTLPGAHRRWLQDPATIASMREALRDGLDLTTSPDIAEHMSVKQRWAIDAMNTVTGGVVAYQAALQSGASQEDALKAGAAGAAMGALTYAPVLPTRAGSTWKWGMGGAQRSLVENITSTVFNRWLPFWKLTTYQMLKPGMEGKSVAAFVNQVYGGLNMLQIGRSRHVQDALRMSVLTPDWTESWARMFGSALFRWGKDEPVGALSRRYWANAAVQGALMLETANLIFGGHSAWENDPDAVLLVDLSQLYDWMHWRRQDPRTGEKVTPYLDILGPLKAIFEPLQLTARAAASTGYEKLGFDPKTMPFRAEIAGEPGKTYQPDWGTSWKSYIGNRTGWLPSTVFEQWNGSDWSGRPISQPSDSEAQKMAGQILQFAQRIIPAGQSDLARGMARGEPPAATILSVLTGMRTRRESDTTRYFKQIDEERKRLGVSDQDWNKQRLDDFRNNQRVDGLIEGYTNGTLVNDSTPVDPMKNPLTPRQRTELIADQSKQRITQRERLNTLVDTSDVADQTEKDRIQRHFNDLQKLNIISGQENVPADPEPDDMAHMDEIYRLAWMKDPHEVARLKGLPRDQDWPANIGEAAQAIFNHPPNYEADRRLADLRSRWLIEASNTWGVDPAVLQDYIKARVYQVTDRNGQFVPPPLPGVTSAQLDRWVDDWQAKGRDEKGNALPLNEDAAMYRQQYVMELARQTGLDPQAIQQRIQLRVMPVQDSTPAAIERRHALDVLNNARFYRYQDEQGNPVGTPVDWKRWDGEIEAARKTSYAFRSGAFGIFQKDGKLDEDLTNKYKWQQQGRANKLKDVLNSQHADDYQHWFGDGADLTEDQWRQYQNGTLDMWKDKPPPIEAKNRTRAMRLWAALTPQERVDRGVEIQGGGPPISYLHKWPSGIWTTERVPLAAYMRYINANRSGAYLLGDLDPKNDPDLSSGGPYASEP